MASEVEVRPGVQSGDLVVGVWPEGKPGRMSVIHREWKAALLDALLRERGYRKVPAVHEDGFHYHRCIDEELAKRKAKSIRETTGIGARVTTIYVPVQGEGE